ncbi:hypothetical protein QTH87_23630 [Variovorax sp. J22P168]|uniref:hypothetical protein n=1 Tax=Variovorax jilinensis TaxID=3053513 RepID=UPI0025774D48|nr:hypothetical protein [Variovorax sp. J22P168]MDM0015455.1 hypothetical protein [Variovorax sp. J22P168]
MRTTVAIEDDLFDKAWEMADPDMERQASSAKPMRDRLLQQAHDRGGLSQSMRQAESASVRFLN